MLLFVTACLVYASAFADPLVKIETAEVVADDLTPGGEAVVFTVARERTTWVTHVARESQIVRDEDGDGQVVLDLEPAFHSVWCVVDLETGRFSVTVPDGFPRKERAIGSEELQVSPEGGVRTLRDDRGYVEVLLVRPRVGAWHMSAGDGAASDADAARDGFTAVEFATMEPVGNSPQPPASLEPGDLVIVVNPRNLEFSATNLSAEGEWS